MAKQFCRQEKKKKQKVNLYEPKRCHVALFRALGKYLSSNLAHSKKERKTSGQIFTHANIHPHSHTKEKKIKW